MNIKILIVLLILTSLMGYLEWSGNNHIFLLQAEADIIKKLVSQPTSVLHPLILAPMAGQILLLATAFQKQPSKILILIGIGSLCLLFSFMLLIGLMSLNFKILISTIPFLVLALLTINQLRKR